MELDHIIIFSQNQGQEADELASFGLTEGSNRIHPGQGTRNRKFYFENFFLEIVWVSNETEIRSESTAPTGLWERANYKINGCSPFGLCLGASNDTHELFEDSLKYCPVYLKEGQAFYIITNKENPFLPWICRLPMKDQKNIAEEPTGHKVGIKRLTKVKFGIPDRNYQNNFTDFFNDEPGIIFEYAEHYHMTLEFDHVNNRKLKKFNQLPLTIKY